MNLKKIGKVFTSKSVGTGPSPYEKRIYRATVSQRLRNTGLVDLYLSSNSIEKYHEWCEHVISHPVKKYTHSLRYCNFRYDVHKRPYWSRWMQLISTYQIVYSLEGCLTMHLSHEIIWNANLIQKDNFIDVFLARHVSGTYAHHQEH